MSDEIPSCEYVGDEIDGDGIVENCPEPAEFVMRGRSGQAMKISRMRGRVLACQKHGDFMKNGAELDWEIIGRGEEDVKRIASREDRGTVPENPKERRKRKWAETQKHLPEPDDGLKSNTEEV